MLRFIGSQRVGHDRVTELNIYVSMLLSQLVPAFPSPAVERNTFESVLMRRMNLDPIIQSEVSQKKKNKYCVLTHIYGI